MEKVTPCGHDVMHAADAAYTADVANAYDWHEDSGMLKCLDIKPEEIYQLRGMIA